MKMPGRLYLVCDGGGTNTRALLFDDEGLVGRGIAGASNPQDAGLDASINNISLAYLRALQNSRLIAADVQTDTLDSNLRQHLQTHPLDGCWCALAGMDTPEGARDMKTRLAQVLSLNNPDALRCTNDCELLTGCIKDTEKGIAIIAGTGSIGMAGRRGGRDEVAVVTTGRAGGYGFLLGDEGSGFHIGKEALRQLLDAWDAHLAAPTTTPLPQGPLLQHTLNWFETESLGELLTSVYQQQKSEHERKKKIAALCSFVMDSAFPSASPDPAAQAHEPDELALQVLRVTSDTIVDMIQRLAREHAVQPVISTLVLGGGAVAANPGYSALVLEGCKRRFGEGWSNVIFVQDPGLQGGQVQAAKWQADYAASQQ